MSSNNQNYWNEFYSNSQKMGPPSQFASFVLNEFFHYKNIVDIGCGNGRDAFFFNQYQKKVLGVDGSNKAIELNSKVAKDNINFKLFSFSKSKKISELAEYINQYYPNAIIYSRFFLHALTNDELDIFFDFLELLAFENNPICIEYRTIKDSTIKKHINNHFRNYLNPIDIEKKINLKKLKSIYFHEGTGLAKYKNEDAYVARHIILKQP
ncbi:MAG: methyltransferase domain-containing protein [Candidatus Marinamargulisbacteria bacterium]